MKIKIFMSYKNIVVEPTLYYGDNNKKMSEDIVYFRSKNHEHSICNICVDGLHVEMSKNWHDWIGFKVIGPCDSSCGLGLSEKLKEKLTKKITDFRRK